MKFEKIEFPTLDLNPRFPHSKQKFITLKFYLFDPAFNNPEITETYGFLQTKPL